MSEVIFEELKDKVGKFLMVDEYIKAINEKCKEKNIKLDANIRVDILLKLVDVRIKEDEKNTKEVLKQ